MLARGAQASASWTGLGVKDRGKPTTVLGFSGVKPRLLSRDRYAFLQERERERERYIYIYIDIDIYIYIERYIYI